MKCCGTPFQPLPEPMITLKEIFTRLSAVYGPRHWWPAETPFEVCVGAILTQNTNWGNVEKAIANLKNAELLDPQRLAVIPEEQLALLIRPAGYFNVKARRLKDFVAFLFQRYEGKLGSLFDVSIEEARQALLEVRGIGPETADSILLYAGNMPSFVVDAYTRRIFSRIGFVPDNIGYEQLRSFFMENMPVMTALFNEYHALIVEHGKLVCRPRPNCHNCCIAECSFKRNLFLQEEF